MTESKWAYLKKSDCLHKFAFFPEEVDNDQSVLSFIVDSSIDIKTMGAKSTISVQSINGPIEMKIFKGIFSKLYIPQCPKEIKNFITFIEENWETLISNKEKNILKL